MTTTGWGTRNLAGIIFCMWAVLIIQETPAMFIKVPYIANKCLSSSISTNLNSAQNVMPSFDVTSENLRYSGISQINCAIKSNTKQALGYTYEDGVCTLYSPGQSLKFQVIIFGPPTFPPVDTLEQMARFKTTYASTHMSSWTADKVVDGIINSDDNMYHSDQGILHPWWMVDIGELRIIHQVQIFPRQACCEARFHNIEIRVGTTLRTDGNYSSYTLMSYYPGPYSTDLGYIICSRYEGVYGRYLTIQRVTDEIEDYLQILDVNIFVRQQ